MNQQESKQVVDNLVNALQGVTTMLTNNIQGMAKGLSKEDAARVAEEIKKANVPGMTADVNKELEKLSSLFKQ